jgi:hypothetical protein
MMQAFTAVQSCIENLHSKSEGSDQRRVVARVARNKVGRFQWRQPMA